MEWGTLSTVALAMSGISLCVRWRFPSVPSFLASAGIGIGFCVLGLSLYPQPVLMTVSVVVNAALIAGMIDYWLSAPELDEAVEGATLRITFHGDERHPTALYLKNIAGWFAYHSPYARIDGLAEDGTLTTLLSTPKAWAIFIAYERPTEVSQIVASLNSPGLPSYNILLSTKRMCVISFSADIPAGDLEIDVRLIRRR